MTVLSIIPGIGGAVIWVPAAIILVAIGDVWQGAILALFCALVVGSVDSVLRPRLVGRDTKMHEQLIFFFVGGANSRPGGRTRALPLTSGISGIL